MRLQALRWFFCCGFDVFTLSLRKKYNIMEDENLQKRDTLDFGPVEDTTKEIIKVVGVGGGGCNAVNNMFNEGIANVSFAVCNTDSQSLANSPVPVKLLLGESGLVLHHGRNGWRYGYRSCAHHRFCGQEHGNTDDRHCDHTILF